MQGSPARVSPSPPAAGRSPRDPPRPIQSPARRRPFESVLGPWSSRARQGCWGPGVPRPSRAGDPGGARPALEPARAPSRPSGASASESGQLRVRGSGRPALRIDPGKTPRAVLGVRGILFVRPFPHTPSLNNWKTSLFIHLTCIANSLLGLSRDHMYLANHRVFEL